MRIARGVALAVFALGCGGGDGGGTTPQATPASISVSVSSPDAMVSLGDTRDLTAVVRDAGQNVIANAQVSWSAASPGVVSLSAASGLTTRATATGNGTTAVTARAGTVSDSKTLTVALGPSSFPTSAAVEATEGNAFSPARVDIAQGGTVTWNFRAVTHNVIFGADSPPGGDIPPSTSTSVSRTFPASGTYGYNCTLHPGMSGSVVVH